MPNAPVAASARGLPKFLASFSRRRFFKGAAIMTAAAVSGGATAPAAASICAAAPYIPNREPDAELLQVADAYHRHTAEDAALWARYTSLPADTSPETRNTMGRHIESRYEAWAHFGDTVYSTVPETPAGAAAMLSVIMCRDGENIEDAVLAPLRLLLQGLNRMARS